MVLFIPLEVQDYGLIVFLQLCKILSHYSLTISDLPLNLATEFLISKCFSVLEFSFGSFLKLVFHSLFNFYSLYILKLFLKSPGLITPLSGFPLALSSLYLLSFDYKVLSPFLLSYVWSYTKNCMQTWNTGDVIFIQNLTLLLQIPDNNPTGSFSPFEDWSISGSSYS